MADHNFAGGKKHRGEAGRLIGGLGLVLGIVGLALVAGAFTFGPIAQGAADKITICHAAGQEGTTQFVTLELAPSAVYGPGGHFNEDGTPQAGHEEDYFGPCVSETTPTATATNTSVATATATATATNTSVATATATATAVATSTATATATNTASPTATSTGVPVTIVEVLSATSTPVPTATPTLVAQVLPTVVVPTPVAEVQRLVTAGSGGTSRAMNSGLLALGIVIILTGGGLLLLSRNQAARAR